MGLFDKNISCAICDKNLGLNKMKIADKKYICANCYKETGITMKQFMKKTLDKWTVQELKDVINSNEENDNEIAEFEPTKKIGPFVEFDDKQRKWLVLSSFLGKRDKSTVYNYSDIVGFELLEDGDSVAKGGLGRALVGGALFGGTGAIVGGVTGKRKSKGICNSLKLKVTVKDINNPVVYITFIDTKTKKDGFTYKNVSKQAQECLSTFQLICDQRNEASSNNETISAADEILKFKNLLDVGAISQEEYDNKKKELLEI